jgi:hypothetical protein
MGSYFVVCATYVQLEPLVCITQEPQIQYVSDDVPLQICNRVRISDMNKFYSIVLAQCGESLLPT